MIRYPIKVLLIEDNPDQVLLIERAFKRHNGDLQVVSVRDGEACVDRLSRERFSAVIVDYRLPEMDGTDVIRRIRQTGAQLPVIMVTGQGDEQVAVMAMKSGASDYIVKTQGYFKQLPAVIEKAIQTSELQSRLKDSEEKYRRLAENANDLIFTLDQSGAFSFLTLRVNELLGYSAEELIGRSILEILTPESQARAEKLLQPRASGFNNNRVELDFVTKSGETKSFELGLTMLVQAGSTRGFEAIGRDITRRLQLEREVMQRNRELTTLLSVTSAMAQSLNIEEISTAALQKICEFGDWNCGAIATLKFSNSSYQVSGSVNLSQQFVEALNDESFLADTLESLLRFKRVLVEVEIRAASSSNSFTRLAELCRQQRIPSFVLLPLFFKEKLLGFVFGGRHLRKDFHPEEIQILNSIGNQISVAIANARLFSAIREAKIEWETTFDAMSELICMQDLEGRIIRVNKALARRLGLEPRDVVNRRAEEVFKDVQSPWCHHQKLQMYEQDKIIALEFEDPVLNGFFEIATSPVYSSDGQLFAWLFVGKDVTDQRHLQNQIVQVERLKALGEMASGVAHDFNNILAGILGKTQVMLGALERGNVPDPQNLRTSLKVIERTTIQGAQTVKRIQDFTRIRTDQKFHRVDLNQVIADAMNIIRPVLRDQDELKGVKIELQFLQGNVPVISGISSELADVIVNVISNAIDAMPEGGVIQISSGAYQAESNEYAEIKIKDTGIGMSSEVKQKVFDPFFSTKGPKGTGLGMSVAYGIVARHHGNISLESELGQGTTCMLHFPAATEVERVNRARTAPMETQKTRILVIDDEDVIRDFLGEMFVTVGHEADVAATGPEGIAMFDAGQYDVVFSDLGLPDMSGWDVAKAIRAKNAQVPIVLLSGWGIQLDDVRIKECGVDLVLSKPCQMDELINAVDEVVKRQKRTQA
jgi:PAS domain S-box-containing protein